ncbi:MAG TPA: hypothetical protein VNI60_03555 [Pyrinomonadaceae bacterium]|jgi:hypothetical protein|nr:hypothetical protein [Pyrinomonadaceae bacterium]
MVFVFLIFSPLVIFSQKKITSNKQIKSVKKIKRTEIVAKIQPEDGIWKELVSEEGRFKILFPKEPEKLVRNKDFPRGNSFIEYKLWTNFRKYSVSFAEFDNVKSLSNEQLNGLYDITRDGIVKDAKGKLSTDNSLQVGNVLGREITYEQENYIVINRYFLNGNKFYQIITVVEKELNVGTNVQEFGKKFLGSFRFID